VVNYVANYYVDNSPSLGHFNNFISLLLLKPQVSVTVTQGVSVVGVAGWPMMLTGWPVTVGVVSQPGADAER